MSSGRKRITAETKNALLERSNGLCSYCGKPLREGRIQIDHVLPYAFGGSDDLENLTLACSDCNGKKAARHYSELVAGQVNHLVQFQGAMETIKVLLQLQSPAPIKASLNRLLYSNVISAMETYLSDKMISNVMSDEKLFRRVLTTIPDFKNEKIAVSNILDFYAGLRAHVQEYLASQIYHKLDKIKLMYGSIFQISFPADLNAVFVAITVRHDIVHRNGKRKDGQFVEVLEDDVTQLIKIVVDLVLDIELRLGAKGY